MTNIENEYEAYCKQIDAVRDEVKNYVLEKGGFVELPDSSQTLILVNEDPVDRWERDVPFFAHAHALKVDEDGDLLVYGTRVHSQKRTEKTREEMESCEFGWYLLDWDCSMSYQHNIERIAYIITYEMQEEEE